MSKPLIIYGNGAMARLLYSYVRHGRRVVGFTVEKECTGAQQELFCGLPLLPFEQAPAIWSPEQYEVLLAVGFVQMNDVRMRIFEQAKQQGYGIASYLHPSFMVHDEVSLGEGCIVLDNVSVHVGCLLGTATFISSNVNIGHDCQIDQGCWINSGVAVAGGCHIKAQSFLGVNACVAHGVVIGARNFIGANTLVARPTGDDEVHISPASTRFPLSSQAFLRFARL